MVLCIIALIVFSILGIFSGHYRGLAKDAFKCVYRMVTLRPCDVQLETKIKNKMTSKLMFVPSLARFFYKNFKPISWIFTISFFASMIYSAYGIYNLLVIGRCDPNSSSCEIASLLYILSCYEVETVSIIAVIAVILFVYFYFKKKNIRIVIR
ncbi:hypothetical protein A3K64_03945 [Candidatus Micrarchaeota archaeon RBG_16_36_9]|nr:MAG: hypothetical protein A3K64_03945 [Candidatus Micrarchaeota archaeon RBG_16_36_9]